MSKKKKGEDKYKITQEDFIKINRRARRELDIELGRKYYDKIHKTTKRDQQESKSNTVKHWDQEDD